MFTIFPRDEKFFQLLDKLTEDVSASSRHLHALMSGTDTATRQQAIDGIKTAKDNAKQVSIELTHALCRSFVTPLDREDIQKIADTLYRIPKTIGKIADLMQVYGIITVQSDFAPQTGIIEQEAEAMRALMKDLTGKGDRRRIAGRAAKLHELENRGDELRSQLIKDLFSSDRDVRDMLIRRDIYDLMERVVDRFRDVASLAVQTVLKHS